MSAPTETPMPLVMHRGNPLGGRRCIGGRGRMWEMFTHAYVRSYRVTTPVIR